MLGSVTLNNMNLQQGAFSEVERYLLFTGAGAGDNLGKVVAVNSNTDLDAVLGLEDSPLKRQVYAAQLNGKQEWNAAVLPLRNAGDWQSAVDVATEADTFEGIALTDPIGEVSQIENMQNKAEQIMSRHMTPVFMAGTLRAPLETESWADYVAAMQPITKNILADQVTVTAALWGPELGAYMGRLCDKSVTVADTPMRTKTGTLLGNWADRPTDKDGRALDMATLYSLDKARISVPQWYRNFAGTYFGDGNVLDIEGGDFQVIEHLRTIQKCMRKVYPLAVGRIGDRTLNETPASIAAAQTAFARPLREMSKTRTILGVPFPGEIHPPEDGAVQIVWLTKTAVELWITARPYNCPKNITVNLLLDLTNYAAAA